MGNACFNAHMGFDTRVGVHHQPFHTFNIRRRRSHIVYVLLYCVHYGLHNIGGPSYCLIQTCVKVIYIYQQALYIPREEAFRNF